MARPISAAQFLAEAAALAEQLPAQRPGGEPVPGPLSLRARAGGGGAARPRQPAAAERDGGDLAAVAGSRKARRMRWSMTMSRWTCRASTCGRGPLRHRATGVLTVPYDRRRTHRRVPADQRLHRRAAAACQELACADDQHRLRSAAPGRDDGAAVAARVEHRRHRAGAAQLRLRIERDAVAARRRGVRRRPAVLPGRCGAGLAARAAPARAGDDAVSSEDAAAFGRGVAAGRSAAVRDRAADAAARRVGRTENGRAADRDLRLHRSRPVGVAAHDARPDLDDARRGAHHAKTATRPSSPTAAMSSSRRRWPTSSRCTTTASSACSAAPTI